MTAAIHIDGWASFREWADAGYPRAVSLALCMVPDCTVVLSTSNDEYPKEIMCRRHARMARELGGVPR